MGRHPKSTKVDKMKKGGWSEEEDRKLKLFLENEGGKGLNWKTISEKAGLSRCGKSCRLRWKNYLSPHITKANFSHQEEQIIIHHQSLLGNKWSQIAAMLPGRTDNDIKNLWNTKLRKRLQQEAIAANSSPINIADDYTLLANNYLISVFQFILNMQLIPQAAKNLLLQDLIIRLQLQPIDPFLAASLPFVSHDDTWFQGGDASVDFMGCHDLPALVSATDDAIENEMNYLSSGMDDASNSELMYDIGATNSFNHQIWVNMFDN